jgi:hypothetical protein
MSREVAQRVIFQQSQQKSVDGNEDCSSCIIDFFKKLSWIFQSIAASFFKILSAAFSIDYPPFVKPIEQAFSKGSKSWQI